MSDFRSVIGLDFLEAVQSLSEDVVFLSDATTGQIHFVGEECLGLLGVSPDELKADASALSPALFPGAVGEPAQSSFERIFKVTRTDGKERLLRARSLPFQRDGTPAVIVGFLRDITAQVHQTEALQESNEQLLAILSTLPDGVLVTCGMRVLFVNRAMCRLLGRAEDAVTGQPLEDVIHPDDLAEFREALTRSIETDATPHATVAIRFRGAKGGWSFGEATSLRSIEFDGWDSVIWRVTDHTAQVRTRAERDRARARYTTLFESSPLGVAILETDGSLVDANPALVRLLEWEQVPENDNLLSHVHPQDRERVALHTRDLAMGVIPRYSRDTRLLTAANTYRPVRLHISAVAQVEDDRPLLISLVEDTSERVSLEQQLRTVARIESIGRLAGGVAHDFNNLVTVITGHAEIVLDETPRTDQRHADLLEILEAAERAKGLTQQLLAFSRRTVQETSVLDLNEVIERTRQLLARTLGEDVDFKLDLQPLVPHVVADRSQLEQVVMNLVVNARDAMPQGGKLTVSTDHVTLDDQFAAANPGAVPGDYLRLQIADTGTGMPPQVLDQVFEPFFTTKPAGMGTGLGLATVYGIVKQSRGYIRLHSTVDVGTVVQVFLPAVHAELSPAEVAGSHAVPGGTETILLVEDEDAVRSLAQRVLGVQGYRVFTASNGQEAIELARSLVGVIDLLVTDVVMPRMGGRELADLMEQHQPGIRVLFISGYPDDALVRRGVQRGTVNLLPKPFTAADFARRVRQTLDGE